MADRIIAQRYATALLSLAGEQNLVDRIGQDLLRVAAVTELNDGELHTALSNPVFTVEERVGVLDSILNRLEVQQLTRNVLKLLLDKGRFSVVREVASSYASMADAGANRARIVVETAEPMSRALEAEVKAALARVTGKDVILEARVDPSLIGGMVARVGSKVYDASVRARLVDIRQKLIEAQIPAEA